MSDFFVWFRHLKSIWTFVCLTLLRWEFLLKWYNFFWNFSWNTDFLLCTTTAARLMFDHFRWLLIATKLLTVKLHFLYVEELEWEILERTVSGVGVGNSGKVGVGVGYFTSDSATLMGAVNKIRKKVPAVKKHMKESLHSLTLYKSCDATITVHQGKANKIWSFSAPSTHASPLLIMPRNPRNGQSLQYHKIWCWYCQSNGKEIHG